LLMHVLSGMDDWKDIIHEASRVCHSGGVVAAGYTGNSEVGINTQLKRQLKNILEQRGISWHRPQESYRQSLELLKVLATRHIHAQAASWTQSVTADEFISRHRSGARFAALPIAVQEQALKELSMWAIETFESLNKEFDEQRSFELDIFEF
jgi:hypothetical protein